MSIEKYKICCIVPTKNQGKYISESVDSILNQTFKSFHLIIVDNGSIDNTDEILNKYKRRYKNSIYPKITITKESNPGTGAALNKGLSINNNQTEYITWWASDNVLNPNAFQELIDYMNIHKDVDMLYANMDIHIFKDEKCIKTRNLQDEVGSQEWTNNDKIFTNYYLGCIWLFRKEIAIKAGEWYMHEPCEDYDQVIRFVYADAKFAFLNKNLGWFRRHDENMSAKLRNTGYAENLVKKMIQIRKDGKGKEWIEYIRWKYNPQFYHLRRYIKFENWKVEMDNDKKLFTRIFEHKEWNGVESVSGKGSDIEQTKRIITRLPHIINKFGIKKILDIGCGDLNWMKCVLEQCPGVEYTGVDIVDELIEENKVKYPQYKFYSFNIMEENFIDYDYDLVICRDILVHYTFNSILSFFYKISQSKCKYILTTTFYNKQNNKDIDLSKGVSWRAINLNKSPISLPDPMENLNERCTQIDTDGTNFKDKSLGLWKIEDIKKRLNINREYIPIDEEKKNFKNIITTKDWHLKKINKVINFYWGNTHLPYLRYLTVKTFSILNPDWEIHFHYPKTITKGITWISNEHKFDTDDLNDYWDDLQLIKNVKFIEVDNGKYKKYPEVMKSDLFRWKLLTKESGVWSDNDIVFVKSMNECEFNLPKNANYDTGVQICDNYKDTYHTIGFMMSGGSNDYFRYICDKSQNDGNDLHNYQSFGVVLLNSEFPKLEMVRNKFKNLNVFNIHKDLLYNFYPLERIQEMYKENGKDYTNDRTIGIHWYGGYSLSGEYCNYLNHQNIWEEKTLLAKKIQKVLKLNI